MNMTAHKAIAAFITAAAGVAATIFAINVDWLSPEIVGVIATVLVTAATYFTANTPVE